MLGILERIGDGLLKRALPSGTAAAQTCRTSSSWCVNPSNACPCDACFMQCWDCAGHEVCNFTGACCT